MYRYRNPSDPLRGYYPARAQASPALQGILAHWDGIDGAARNKD
jgi:hypothetical protein